MAQHEESVNTRVKESSLLNTTVFVVKRNPIKVSLYLIGLLVCLLFNGIKVNDDKLHQYNQSLAAIDVDVKIVAQRELDRDKYMYHRTKGWFSCDAICTENKIKYESSLSTYKQIEAEQYAAIKQANSHLGIFSTYAVDDARKLFWQRFSMGKNVATRNSKYDFIFNGIASMGKDEGLVEYIFRCVMSVLINFTIGMLISAVTFIYGLIDVVRGYNPSYLHGFVFYMLGSVAACSFLISWIAGLYFAVIGTALVGGKLLVGQSIARRVRDANEDGGYRRRVRRE